MKENQNKIVKRLFLFSFFYLLFLGILLSYNYDLGSSYNLLFDSDTGRIVLDATETIAEHYRAAVHPLFILWVQPMVLLLGGFLHNKILSIIVLSSLVTSLSVVYLYKTLETIKEKEKSNILLSLIYLFAFSNIIFTTGLETYNFAACFLIMMWYYFIRKEKEKFDTASFGILVLLAVMTFSFTITNILIYGIMIGMLWITKKIHWKNILGVGVISILLVVGLNICQKVVWQEAPFFWRGDVNQELEFVQKTGSVKEKVKNVLTNDYYNSLLSSKLKMEIRYGTIYNQQNYIITFDSMNIFNFIILSLFYILLIFLLARNFTKKKIWNSSLLLALGVNTVLHMFYGVNSTFLYSLHFLYIPILLLGTNLLLEEDKTWKKTGTIFLGIFLIIECIQNNYYFYEVLKMVKEVINPNYLMANLKTPTVIALELGMLLVVAISLGLICFCIKAIKKEKKIERKILVAAFLVLIVIGNSAMFLELETAEGRNSILWKVLAGNPKEIKSKTKEDYLQKDFKKYFKEEFKQLDAYKKEIEQFQEEFDTVEVNSLNWTDYYYFGLGNRRKLVYRPGVLLDIDTKEVVESFTEEEHFVIPNSYTVIIKTKENDYIKIVEKEDGVHFVKNKEEKVIEGTTTKINLYSFKGQKYEQMKKELYGETLFNIKEGVIYPNFIVYEKPWYRDGAMTCMVLKQTKNTDLIKDWVAKIEDIYDRQNAGIEEADNLGELLYILSTQEDKREDLIDKIEEEAERIARENPDGYYITGKTDFGSQPLYQNLWYKLGIEAVGRSYHFDLESIPQDGYSKMAWWSDYQVEARDGDASKEFPYLSYAERHKGKIGQITINKNLYPLSWEIGGSQAKYENYKGIDDQMISLRTSPLHSWSSSELLLLLLEETGDYQKD